MKAAFVLTAVLLLAADDATGVRWTFEDAEVGKVPVGWSRAQTGKGEGSVWKIQQDQTAPTRTA